MFFSLYNAAWALSLLLNVNEIKWKPASLNVPHARWWRRHNKWAPVFRWGGGRRRTRLVRPVTGTADCGKFARDRWVDRCWTAFSVCGRPYDVAVALLDTSGRPPAKSCSLQPTHSQDGPNCAHCQLFTRHWQTTLEVQVEQSVSVCTEN